MERGAYTDRDQVCEGYLEFREKFYTEFSDFARKIILGAQTKPIRVKEKYEMLLGSAVDELGVELGAFEYLIKAKKQLDHAFVNKNKVE